MSVVSDIIQNIYISSVAMQEINVLTPRNDETSIDNQTNLLIDISEMFLGLICWSLERKFPRVSHISTEQLDLKIHKQR